MQKTQFTPAWWLPGSHLQTIWPTLCKRRFKQLPIKRERVELADGDFIDLDWAGEGAGPIVIVLHGLEGSIDSGYARGMLYSMVQQGWRGVLMHFRSCSGELNRLPRMYHSGETQDIAEIVNTLRVREPETSLAAIGFSLGGNVLLKWLGETKQDNPLKAAIAVSVPFELNKTAARVQQGFSRFYQWYLLRNLLKKIQKKAQEKTIPFNVPPISALRSLFAFDDHITAPLHGFDNAEDYYAKSSSRQYLKYIEVPTLLLQAKDDPFMTDDILPEPHELAALVKLELSRRGGHVGFVTGSVPWRPTYWLEQRVPAFLKQFL